MTSRCHYSCGTICLVEHIVFFWFYPTKNYLQYVFCSHKTWSQEGGIWESRLKRVIYVSSRNLHAQSRSRAGEV